MENEIRLLKVNDNKIIYGNARFTVLTNGLLRMEYSENRNFVDSNTQMVVSREFPKVNYKYYFSVNSLVIETERFLLRYNGEGFSPSSLSIELKGNLTEFCNVWHFGDIVPNLGGTARTLDGCDGECTLENGIFSRYGYSIIDDSNSMLIENNWITPKEEESIDMYYFGYGTDFFTGLKDFYHLSGNSPLLPRFALGNWWSKFYSYSDDEYLNLMKNFKNEGTPFSVGVLDMDWHIVDVESKYGSGWTGYSWNHKLFPKPKDFIEKLHNLGLHVALNDHPFGGIRPFEDNYELFAKELKENIDNKPTIPLNFSSKKFFEKFQKCILDPLEEEGVDFWWIDWQQGTICQQAGLDPLWVLNYTRYKAEKNHNRSIILSRYAGLGSHRFPLGFSGDTIISWESLKFQPYFTLTASNAGYGWWSHDIGGHMQGKRDEELTLRWFQWGVFSPIMRLHSSNNSFSGKEPSNFSPSISKTMKKFLQLRHSLIPYTYTMNAISHFKGEPLIRPLYYHYPKDSISYEIKNEYFFGTEMIVIPLVEKMDPLLKQSSSSCWIPPGIYYDYFSKIRYEGPKKATLFRGLENIPVLIKAGGIIVQTDESNINKNPERLIINCYAGANGTFNLYEDDGITDAYQKKDFTETKINFSWDNKELTIFGVKKTKYLPEKRSYQINLFGVTSGNSKIFINEQLIPIQTNYLKGINCLQIEVKETPIDNSVQISFDKNLVLKANNIENEIYERLNFAMIDFDLKEELLKICNNEKLSKQQKLYALMQYRLDKKVILSLSEILCAEDL